MKWEAWVLVAFFAIGTCKIVLNVDKPVDENYNSPATSLIAVILSVRMTLCAIRLGI